MNALRARISIVEEPNYRKSPRRLVELSVSLGPVRGLGWALVRNLSEDGMMLETDVEFQDGETILVDLPNVEQVEAHIMWRQDSTFGCAFLRPIPTAAVIAALLHAPPGDVLDPAGQYQIEEFPVGTRPTLDELADWKSRFERTKGADGYRIIAYRQASGGLMIAVAARTTTN